jgi:FkbM family methyltransferase
MARTKSSILEALLDESLEDAYRREINSLDLRLDGCQGIVLFGCGKLGQKLANALRSAGRPALAFADNSQNKWETLVVGLPVLSPSEAARRYGDRAAFIVSIWAPQHRFLSTQAQLDVLGCRTILPFQLLLWAYPDKTLPHYQFERPSIILQAKDAIRKTYDLWHDDESRQQFLAHLRWRLRLDFDGLPTPTPESQYFVEGIMRWQEDLVFVDGGAYDGDTLRRMLAYHGDGFSKYLAIEPDPKNFARLWSYWEGLPSSLQDRVDLILAALSNCSGEASFDAAGATRAALSESGGTQVPTVTLDGLLPAHRPCYIKLDLEGAERQALEGGRIRIQRSAPNFAVCVYHRPGDLWELPNLLHTWQPRYRFHLRTHDQDGLEIVVYATAED